MANVKEWFVRTEDGKVYGPADVSALVAWAKDGRIEPSGFLSQDRRNWMPAQLMPELEMKWLVETEPGKVFGPFNRALVISLYATKSVPPSAKAYRLHKLPVDQDPPPVEKIVEVPVEKIVEKIVEVEPPPRTEIVVPEVVEPTASVPPQKPPSSIFGNLDRDGLAALEAAALAKGVALSDTETEEAYKRMAVELALRTGSAKEAQRFVEMATSLADRRLKREEIKLKGRAQETRDETLKLAREKFEAAERRENAAKATVTDAKLTEAERLARLKEIYGI